MPDIKTVTDKADMIINGYAFTREDDYIHVLNLNSPDGVLRKVSLFNPTNVHFSGAEKRNQR